jgi:hypothetical protein
MDQQRQAFFRLTKQRKTVLDLLCRYTYLCTSHFYALVRADRDGAQRAVRRLLHDFWKRGYLVRRPVIDYDAPGPLPRYENVYWLSSPGVELLRDGDWFDGGLICTPEKSPHSLEHDVAITQFHLEVERFCNVNGWTAYWQQHHLKRTVNPDALFALTDPRRPEDESTLYYFLEMERSRRGSYRDGRSGLLRKLERYARYHGSEECFREWEWFDEFRVVIVVKNEMRKENLLALLSENLPEPAFWITIEGSDLTSPVFFSPGDPIARYSFLD